MKDIIYRPKDIYNRGVECGYSLCAERHKEAIDNYWEVKKAYDMYHRGLITDKGLLNWIENTLKKCQTITLK